MQQLNLTGLSVLVLEDDPLLMRQITSALEKLGGDVTGASNLASARAFSTRLDFDFALFDLNLPDGLSLELLRERVFPENTGVIIMTANSNVSMAVEAMRLGALDYLIKPFNPAELPLVIERARRARQNARRNEFQSEESGGFFFGTALEPVKIQLDKILAADRRIQGYPAPVLIHGETGTGKSTIARWIHQQGPRGNMPIVEVNCSALPESLAESELFGHERGAFTDARTARMGLFEAASGGTLFLDELPSLSLPLQGKVLTAIEDHKIRRVGGNKPIEVDVRLIAATSVDLRQKVAERAFREDLYHRLDLFRVFLPPLRERGQDILNLAESLLSQICRRHRSSLRPFSPSGRERLLHYRWPGNVRELAHELERAVVFEENGPLEFHNLAGEVESKPQPNFQANDWFNDQFVFPESGFNVEEAVLRIIHHALKQTGGNRSAAARLLGVPRDYLRYRLEKDDKSESTREET